MTNFHGAPVTALLALLAGCRPGLPEQDSSSGDSAEACDQLIISGTCFFAIDSGMAGGVELVADLDLDGDSELLLEVDASLVLLDLGPGDTAPSSRRLTQKQVG